MLFVKGLGLGIYYRLRRMNKAFKNWRKFGVIIFGSIFLLSNLIAPMHLVDEATASGLTYLYIDPSTLSIEQGKTYQLSYRAEDQNHQPITITPDWSMSKITAGSVTSTGLFTACSTPGTYNNAIKLSSGALSTYARVIVTASTENGGGNIDPPVVTAKLTYLYIDPSTLSVAKGKTYQFNYRAEDQNHNPITVIPNWSMSKATAGSITSTGFFTAGNTVGTYNNAVKLTSGALSTYARVIVTTSGPVVNPTPNPNPIPDGTAKKLTYLYIDPSTLSIEQGKSYQFKYRAEDQNHDLINITSNWSMSNATAGSITSTGIFTAGTTIGTYNNAIKLSSGALSTYARVIVYTNVQPAKILTSVTINPATARLAVGTQKQFTATAYDQNGAVISSGVTFQWSLTNNLAGNINQAGLFTADYRTGNYSNLIKVVATYAGISKLAFASAEVFENVVDSILQYVVINPTTATLDMGSNYQFGVTAYNQSGQVINNQVNFSWITVNGGGSVNQNGLFTAGYNAGTYTNTVKVTGTKNGISRSAYATIIVREMSNQSLLERVEITPTSVNVRINNQTDFNAQAYDSNNNPIDNASYYWTVISGPGSINQNGLFSAGNLTGTATIQVKASQGGRDRYALATAYVYDNQINDTDLSYVRITPTIAYLNSGSSIDFDAQAYNSLGQLVSADYSWDLMSNIGTLNQNGYFTAGSNIGTFYDAIRVRAYRNGVERVDYADVVISSSSNNQNNYGLSATLTANDENGGSLYENEVVTYTLQLTNNRTNTLNGTTATFDIPTYTSFMSVMSNDGTSSINGKTIRWEAGTLSANATKTLTIKVRVNSSVPSNSVIRGKAYVWASEINAFWVFANDLFALGTAQPTGNEPLTDTGAIDWLIAGMASLVATILSKKFLIRSLL